MEKAPPSRYRLPFPWVLTLILLAWGVSTHGYVLLRGAASSMVLASGQPMTAVRAEAAEPPMRPYVVVHVAVSLDGHTTGFSVDLARFYSLLPTWQEDITLTGADTILAQERELAVAPRPGPADGAPLLVVVDSGRRVREWEALRDCGYWSGVLPLRASSRPATGEPPIPELVVGSDRVDLRQALTQLASRTGARVVRVDSGGRLTRALLDLRLVDEVSLVVHPCLTYAGSHRWYGSDPPPALTMTRLAVETFDPELVWLRYRIEQPDPDSGAAAIGGATQRKDGTVPAD